MVERPAAQPGTVGIATRPPASRPWSEEGHPHAPREPNPPQRLIDVRCDPGHATGRLSEFADEMTESVRIGVVKAEFFYRHARRLANFRTRGSAVATAMAAAALGYGIGLLLHG